MKNYIQKGVDVGILHLKTMKQNGMGEVESGYVNDRKKCSKYINERSRKESHER